MRRRTKRALRYLKALSAYRAHGFTEQVSRNWAQHVASLGLGRKAAKRARLRDKDALFYEAWNKFVVSLEPKS